MEIKGQIALITGGASGLGEATARKLVAAGGKAAILDLNEERGNQLVAELGADAIFVMADVVDAESVQRAINKVVEIFGGLHILVNSAGIGTPEKVLGKSGPATLELFNRVIQINLVGTFNVIRLAVEKMVKNEPNREGERGVIINTASGAAFEGQIGQASYSASKGGLVSMTLPVARELAVHGIRVMTISPGLFDTPMISGMPEKAREAIVGQAPFPARLGKPAEYAMLVQAIVENPMLNATTIRLDGGLRMQAK
ncbi:MAG: 3-hydroxyacyl-CoA dehydrogenase [Bacillota bacterium]